MSEKERNRTSALIVIGGFAGAGKTAVSRRLSAELHVPRLASDTIGRTIRRSAGVKNGRVDAYWIAYEVLFGLCEEATDVALTQVLARAEAAELGNIITQLVHTGEQKANPESRLNDALAVFAQHTTSAPQATGSKDQDAFLKQAQEKARKQNPHNVGMR